MQGACGAVDGSLTQSVILFHVSSMHEIVIYTFYLFAPV
jgi:hypothetical protein